jgi:hypothetical protein
MDCWLVCSGDIAYIAEYTNVRTQSCSALRIAYVCNKNKISTPAEKFKPRARGTPDHAGRHSHCCVALRDQGQPRLNKIKLCRNPGARWKGGRG